MCCKIEDQRGRKQLVSLYNCEIGLKDNDLCRIIPFSNFEGMKSTLALSILHFNFLTHTIVAAIIFIINKEES